MASNPGKETDGESVMDKMREEFEAWHIKQCEADGMDLRDISSELDRNGDGYVYIGAQYAWRGWKASRAALCVELPPQWFSRSDDKEVMSAIGVIDALNCSGVRYE